MKHIEVKHHFIRDSVSRGDFQLEWCSTDENHADGLTKALGPTKYKDVWGEIGFKNGGNH